MLNIRIARPDDAEHVSTLIRSVMHLFFENPEGKGADRFIDSTSVERLAVFIGQENVRYWVAEFEGELCGAAALKDNKHLQHLFVANAKQGQGLGKALWQKANEAALANGSDGEFSVNASLNAVPVYESFGFICSGAVQHANGVIFQPMKLSLSKQKNPLMTRQLISSGSTFEAQIGYSRAVVVEPWVFVSGTTGFDYSNMTISDDVVQQTEQCFLNIQSALVRANSSLKEVVRVTYILPVAADFEKCWPVLQRYLADVRPAATMISAGVTDARIKIEIEVTAMKGSAKV
jgi:enamine deaminase RidA (YjgF/YER057c/UK114 family)/GNAT superfamily N-acetyltransferase